MALTKPVLAVGRARLRILGPDKTFRDHLAADGASWNWSKAVDGSALTFTANFLEAALAADPDLLEDAFAVVQLDTPGGWVSWGTPYALAPGQGTVLSAAEGSARDQGPVSVGALQALLSECLILPAECVDDSPTMRKAAGYPIGGDRIIGWPSKLYEPDEMHPGTWFAATIYTPPADSPKDGKPEDWDPNAEPAEWVGRPSGTGGLLLARFGSITLAERKTVKILYAGDEGGKVHCDGPNLGGIVVDQSGDETSYTDKEPRRLRLEPGTYHFAGEMNIVDSEGGDGNDSMRFAVGTIDEDGAIDELLLASGEGTIVRRQSKGDERPGFSPMMAVRLFLEENSALGSPGADMLLDGIDFTDESDSRTVPEAQETTPEDRREWSAPLGSSLASFVVDSQEDADWHLTPTFVFQCFLDRGEDRGATPGTGLDTVQLKAGANPPTADMNLTEYGWNSDPAGPTRYLTLSQDGFDLVIGETVELTAARSRWGFFETNASASIARARRNARSAIRQTGEKGRRYYRARALAVDAAHTPGIDDAPADKILAIDFTGDPTDLETTDIGGEQDEGSVEFTYDLTEAS